MLTCMAQCSVFWIIHWYHEHVFSASRSSRSEVLLRKGVLKTCNKFTGEHPCRSVISIKLLWVAAFVHRSSEYSFTSIYSCTFNYFNCATNRIKAILKCSTKWVFLKFSQNWQENTCVGDSFSIKLQGSGL